MATRMLTTLVCDTVRTAIQALRPATGVVVHPDRDNQYTCDQYHGLLAEANLAFSISGDDNS